MIPVPSLVELARECAGEAPALASSEQLMRHPAFDALLQAIRQQDARFAFERTGRPEAIAAIRDALPAVEQDLFDAVVEDHACEVAALGEALFTVLCAVARPV
jgi:hypothetical protein